MNGFFERSDYRRAREGRRRRGWIALLAVLASVAIALTFR